MPNRQAAYLEAMGIEQWVQRNAEPTQSAIKQNEVQEPSIAIEEPVPVVAPPVESPKEQLKLANLPDFPVSREANILIVCGVAAGAEGLGSAFEAEAANLLNAMLKATQWPAQSCALLAGVDQLSLALEELQPNLIVALGEEAAQTLLQGSVKAKRQQVHSLPSAKVVVSYHPVQVQADPKQLKRPIWEDLKLAMAEVAQ